MLLQKTMSDYHDAHVRDSRTRDCTKNINI